jgi:hypothetical protein
MGELEILGITRCTRTMFVDAVVVVSAGVKTPSSRNCLTLPMRRSEEAEGDSRMMGSRRLAPGLRWLATRTFCGRDGGRDFGSVGRLRRNLAATAR